MPSNLISTLPRPGLYCVWIATGNPRQPLACIWIDAETRGYRLEYFQAVPTGCIASRRLTNKDRDLPRSEAQMFKTARDL